MPSLYVRQGYTANYDASFAEKFRPIIYDPYDYGREYDPGLFFRVLEGKGLRCIQYYLCWNRQDCTKSYLITEPNTTGAILGLILAIGELILTNVLSLLFPVVFFLPWWVHFTIFFVLGAFLGYRYNNNVGDGLEKIMGVTIGRLFSHEFDFEPIFVYLEDDSVAKVVISGRGDIDAEPHRNDIYVNQDHLSEGISAFLTADKPSYPLGRRPSQTNFKEFPAEQLTLHGSRPVVAVITCYHAFTAKGVYYDEDVFRKPLDITLRPLTDEVLTEWYEQKNFGHDVSDPFELPYLKFAEPQGVAQYGRREYALGFLQALGTIIQGVIKLKNFIFLLFRRG